MLLHAAIQALRPGKEFTMFDDDPSTIIWNDTAVKTPRISEIKQKYDELLIIEKQEADAKIANRQSAKTKLAALGLNEDEINALIGSINERL